MMTIQIDNETFNDNIKSQYLTGRFTPQFKDDKFTGIIEAELSVLGAETIMKTGTIPLKRLF